MLIRPAITCACRPDHCFDQMRGLFPRQRAIVASGHSPTERAELAFQKGLTGLSKPYTVDALANAVEDALAERRSSPVVRLSSRAPVPFNQDDI